MATKAILGLGVSFDVKVSDSWVHIGEVEDISGPNLSSDDVEVTNHDSQGGYREYIAGLKDGGSISISGNFVGDDAGQVQMLADQKSGTVREYRMLLPDAEAEAERTRWAYLAAVTSVGFTYPPGDAMKFSGEFKISGEPELYADLAGEPLVVGANSEAATTDNTNGTATIAMTVHDTDGNAILGITNDEFKATIDGGTEAAFADIAEMGHVTYVNGVYYATYTNAVETYAFTDIKARNVVIQASLSVVITNV